MLEVYVILFLLSEDRDEVGEDCERYAFFRIESKFIK